MSAQPSDRLSVGFLSTAKINDLLLDAARQSDQVEVVAVASRDADRAAAYARSGGSGGRTAPTRRSSRTRESPRSTSRCRTRSTTSGR